MASFRTTRNKNQYESLVTKVAKEKGVTNAGVSSPLFVAAVYTAFEMGYIDIILVADGDVINPDLIG